MKIYEIRVKIRQWSTCGNPLVQTMSSNMIAKFDKYWSDIQGLMGIATVLDPRVKTLSLLMCFEWLLGMIGQVCEDKVGTVMDLLRDLMHDYHVDVEEVEDTTNSSATSINNMEFLSSFSARYLEDGLVPLDTKGFNVLDWWKVAGTRYPTLRRIARDIYAIPVTTVAYEVAFSTSGRVLREHCSRLTPQVLEALMCSQEVL
jgi:hypothetical protein